MNTVILKKTTGIFFIFRLIIGISGFLALFTAITAFRIKCYSLHISNLLSFYSSIVLFICLPIYAVLLIYKTREFKTEFNKLKYAIKHTLISFLTSWMVCCLFIYVEQDNLYFLTKKTSNHTIQQIKNGYKNAEEITIKTIDNATLHGFFIKSASHNSKSPLVIFFNGSAGDILDYVKIAEKFSKKGYSTALINYRGFGLSKGNPGEKEFYSDSQLIFDHFSKRGDVDNNNIIAMGGSMGTGVALNLATKRPVKALVLFSPYDKIAGGTIQDTLPFLPTSILFKNKFYSMSDAHSVKAPALCLVAENDRIIKPSRSMKLARGLGGKCNVKIISDADHLSIYFNRESWEHVYKFLDSVI